MKRLSPGLRKFGFTLIELLVVISIIVILMSLLLAVVPAVKNAARKLEAKNITQAVVVAATNYYTEYAKFPPLKAPEETDEADPEKDQWVGDVDEMAAPLPNNALLFTLRNIAKGPNVDNATNPRKVSYLDVKGAAVSDAGKPRGGFFDRTNKGEAPPTDQDGCLYDPWGRQYGVMLDTTGDERIDLQPVYTDFGGAANTGTGKAPRKRAGAFSMGKDEKLGNKGDKSYKADGEKSDDVLSWED